jgi:5,5'-dehydrodivanillate O-demethylase
MIGSDGYVQEDTVVFPNLLRRVNQIQIHVPLDDTHTNCFKLYFDRERNGHDADLEAEPVDYYVQDAWELKEKPGVYPDVRYRMNELGYQDIMAIETQGGVVSRPDWHLGTADRAIVLFERMLLREMDRVQAGHDPVAVVREPNQVVETRYEFFRECWQERMTQVAPAGAQMFVRSRAPSGAAPERSPAPTGARS